MKGRRRGDRVVRGIVEEDSRIGSGGSNFETPACQDMSLRAVELDCAKKTSCVIEVTVRLINPLPG
jgi:hypothetical protein